MYELLMMQHQTFPFLLVSLRTHALENVLTRGNNYLSSKYDAFQEVIMMI